MVNILSIIFLFQIQDLVLLQNVISVVLKMKLLMVAKNIIVKDVVRL